MTPAAAVVDVKIPVPQRYKDYVVSRQYRFFGYIFAGVYGGINLAYYLLCVALHWKWRFHFQADMLLPVFGLLAYILEVRKPWHYEVNERFIKLLVVNPKSQLASLRELHWAKTEIVGAERAEWQGMPSLRLTVLPARGHEYLVVYTFADKEEVESKVLPLIEKYRRQYRQQHWTDNLRS